MSPERGLKQRSRCNDAGSDEEGEEKGGEKGEEKGGSAQCVDLEDEADQDLEGSVSIYSIGSDEDDDGSRDREEQVSKRR